MEAYSLARKPLNAPTPALASRAYLFAIALALGWPDPAAAHGGGLNKQGCHNNRKTGDYHCHRGSGLSSKPERSSKPTGDVYYANCSAARAAGAAPVSVGDPGYARHLDRDNDGVGCELS